MNSGLYAQLACIWEATARKPGNVHPTARFIDSNYLDYLASAAAIAPVLDNAHHRPVGETILAAIRATRQVVSNNTNLGLVLLLAPLAAVGPQDDFRRGLQVVLCNLGLEDARLVYEAIRLAAPAGLGQVDDQDIQQEPTEPLQKVMALAADRDLIARQYANGFCDIFDQAVPALKRGLDEHLALEPAIIGCHLDLMAHFPDTLIARKRGREEAKDATAKARAVLEAGWPGTSHSQDALAALDAWLRAEGHSRNPGTTADLVAACLFVALRQGIIKLPLAIPWPRSSSSGSAGASPSRGSSTAAG
jgi:triphosphoribosyl-dephospho-CoA synthase